ncbi:A/G-specific adenine glycosylase [hydrothermal vent metagenome]|uniref:Adenine DNA glycosylase n=1 Tax=hydrothermal vent metagenome TaxID=652676 RepID=A0A3B1BNZ2_9ZZZZ
MPDSTIAQTLLTWFDQHGRHDLPWQHPRTLYRVWVSEIMLQQTQVTTVIPYFNRFMDSFPDIRHLAQADEDKIMQHWSGLGYYARARNLHKAARQIIEQHAGIFPENLDEVLALPGIGRSTAAAILAQACGQRHAILDGNVKRVLTRLYAIEGWPGQKAVADQLWILSENITPRQRLVDYTQTIMDFGAILCRRSQPRCGHCPISDHCQAFRLGQPQCYPSSKPRKTLPVKTTRMLLLRNKQGHVLLLKRPPSGIWGSLWSLPECDHDLDITAFCREQLGIKASHMKTGNVLRHSFSHFHLDITPVTAHASPSAHAVMAPDERVWYNSRQPDSRGLPAPVKRLLEQQTSNPEQE